MSGFSTKTLKVATADGRNCTLLEPFSYTTKAGEVITVPAGTTSDGASTPRPMWESLPPFGTYWPAAFLHDYLYRDSKREKGFCDSTFLEAMESLGVGEFEAHTIYEGVHLFGWSSFKEDREAQPA